MSSVFNVNILFFRILVLSIRQYCAVVVPSPMNCDDHHGDRVFKLSTETTNATYF